PFSTYGQDKSWVAYSWLFEVIVYELHRAFGLAGPIIYQLALALAIVAAGHRVRVRREPGVPVRPGLSARRGLSPAAPVPRRAGVVHDSLRHIDARCRA